MNIYDFVNSRDIRDYLEEQNCVFDPLQQAYLVWQSRRHTLAEKHAAWREIIESTPDMAVPKRLNCAGWDSLHKMLADYMNMENKHLARFEIPEKNAVYTYATLERMERTNGAHHDTEWFDNGFLFTQSFRACFDTAFDLCQSDGDYLGFRIIKQYFDQPLGCHIRVTYDEKGEVMSVECGIPSEHSDGTDLSGNTPFLTEYESELYCESFQGLWYDIPIPFKRGDIVCDCFRKEPFVLLGTVPWFYRKRRANRNSNGDHSDMAAYGYSYDAEDGFLYDDYRCEYLNLEYYREKLTGGERLLEAYRQYEKGKSEEMDGKLPQVDAWTLLGLHHMYWAEQAAERAGKQVSWFLELQESGEREEECDGDEE